MIRKQKNQNYHYFSELLEFFRYREEQFISFISITSINNNKIWSELKNIEMFEFVDWD